MDNKKDNIEKFESISTIIVNIGTIVSWLLTIFTAFVLTSQPQQISLPGILELNTSYKLLFLTSIFLGYLQLLKRSWENQKRSVREIEGSFASYIYGSVIKFKRPLVFIGFLMILSIIAIVIYTEVAVLGVIMTILGISFLATIFLAEDGILAKKIKWQFDDDFRKRWLKRVKKQLYKNGYTHTGDFLKLADEIDEINWAIKLYFHYYEFEQSLIFNQRYLKSGLESYEVCEIRFPQVESSIDNE